MKNKIIAFLRRQKKITRRANGTYILWNAPATPAPESAAPVLSETSTATQ